MRDVHGLSHPFTCSLRIFSIKPWFSLTVIGMLAVGIAGNSATFSVFNSLFLRPLPFLESERLIDLDETAPQWNLVHVGVSNPDLYQWRTQNSSFENMAFFRRPSCNLSVGDTTERILSAQVTREMLDILRLRPLVGRNFSEDEDRPGGAPVALLSYGLWQRLFAGNRAVLGEAIKIDDHLYTVIGVLPPEAVFPDRAELWVPLAPDPNANTGYYANGIGRLRPGVPIQRAEAELLRIHKAMIAEGRTINAITSPILTPLRDRYLGDFKMVGRVLLGAVAMVLLIACVNIASLMLVHSAGRSREIAIRTALGASRGRIARHLFAESAALAFIGGTLGILTGAAGLRALVPFLTDKLPQWVSFSPDWRFMLFSFAITGAATMLFGLLPAFHSSRVDLRGSLQDVGARTTPPRDQRARLNAFVICEISLALVLSICAGLLVQAFRKVTQVDPGFQPDNVLTFSVRIPDTSYHKPEQKTAYYDQLLERLQAMPGINTVGATSALPLGGQWGGVFEAAGGRSYNPQGDNPTVVQVAVTPGYFRAIGMTLLKGRLFQEQDGEPKPRPVAIVNETFAKHFWNGGSPLGRRIRRIGASDWLEVVGVLRDEKHYGLDQAVLPSVFLPYPTALATALGGDERTLQEMSIVLRCSSDPSQYVDPARQILRQIDPDVPMYAVQTMMEKLDGSLSTREAYSWLFGVFAMVAISLGAAGIYGTVSYGVAQRTREIGLRMALGARRDQVLAQVLLGGGRTTLLGVTAGLLGALGATNWFIGVYSVMAYNVSLQTREIGIRMALGAQRDDVLRAVLRRGTALIGMGAAFGIFLAWAVTRLIQNQLWRVKPTDPWTLGAVTAVVLLVGLFACAGPARRAAKVDPMVALRYE